MHSKRTFGESWFWLFTVLIITLGTSIGFKLIPPEMVGLTETATPPMAAFVGTGALFFLPFLAYFGFARAIGHRDPSRDKSP
jgi:hypothetical protein